MSARLVPMSIKEGIFFAGSLVYCLRADACLASACLSLAVDGAAVFINGPSWRFMWRYTHKSIPLDIPLNLSGAGKALFLVILSSSRKCYDVMSACLFPSLRAARWQQKRARIARQQ